jgi:hypothetical protein
LCIFRTKKALKNELVVESLYLKELFLKNAHLKGLLCRKKN